MKLLRYTKGLSSGVFQSRSLRYKCQPAPRHDQLLECTAQALVRLVLTLACCRTWEMFRLRTVKAGRYQSTQAGQSSSETCPAIQHKDLCNHSRNVCSQKNLQESKSAVSHLSSRRPPRHRRRPHARTLADRLQALCHQEMSVAPRRRGSLCRRPCPRRSSDGSQWSLCMLELVRRDQGSLG